MTARPTKFIIFSGLMNEAWVSIGASPLRTFLAVLGIIIGVGSVVLMMAIGTGSRRTVEETINALGGDLLIISPGSINHKGLRSNDISKLNMNDVVAINHLPSVSTSAPSTYARPFQTSIGDFNWNAQVFGTTPEYFDVRNRTFDDGNGFDENDMRLAKPIAVLGATVSERLFPQEIKAGKSISGRMMQINGIAFYIAGVLTPAGGGFDGRNQDNAIFIPITTAAIRLWGQANMFNMVQTIYVKAISKDALDVATAEITDLLRQRHRLREDQGDNFKIQNMVAIMKTAADTSAALSLLLGAIASISLVVGGIGIMNIMLVTVTERTREIGIRKAIGATERDILLQFLMEAVMIAAIGSLAGLILGFGGGFVAEKWFFVRVEYGIWPVALALAVAVGIGILSGIYPAHKAAKLHPIEALRVAGT